MYMRKKNYQFPIVKATSKSSTTSPYRLTFSKALCVALAWCSLNAPYAVAQDQSKGVRVLEEVIVTAQRREERLQSVPMSISAFSGEVLAQKGLTRIDSVADFTPNFVIVNQFVSTNAIFSMRGQVQSDTSLTTEHSVGVYFDDIYIGKAQGTLLNFVDVERVEVLKGPQGTLYGRNTTGGAVKVISKKPVDEFEAYLKASYESEGDKRVYEGMVNMPLVADTLSARISGQWSDLQDGYYTNGVTGNPIDSNETQAGRVALRWTPNDRLDVIVQGDYSDTDAGSAPLRLQRFDITAGPGAAASALQAAYESGFAPTGANLLKGVEILCGYSDDGCQLPASLGGQFFPSQHYDRDVMWVDMSQTTASVYGLGPDPLGLLPAVPVPLDGSGPDPKGDSEVWGLSANVSYDFGAFTMKSITAWREVDTGEMFSLNGVPFQIINNQRQFEQKQFSQEFLFNGDVLDGRLNWTAGAYYFWEDGYNDSRNNPLYNITFGGQPTSRVRAGTTATSEQKSTAVFGQGAYAFTDRFSLTVGARYTYDDRELVVKSMVPLANGTSVCGVPASVLPDPAVCRAHAQVDFTEFTWDVSANYQLTDEQMVYWRIARGYRAGGFTERVQAGFTEIPPFDPEYVIENEIGFKGDWLNGTLRTNLAAFYDSYKDIQQTRSATVNNTVLTLVENVGKAKNWGLEADMAWQPVDWLAISAYYGYLNADIDSENPDQPSEIPIYSPKRSGGASITVYIPVAPGKFDLMARLDYSYRGDQRAAPAMLGSEWPDFDGRDLLNGRIALTHLGSGTEVSVYAKNLTDEEYYTKLTPINGLGTVVGQLAPPRVIGLEVKVPFGAQRR